MTVNELYGVWLYNKDTNADVKVWSKKETDYIFSIQKPIENQDVNKIAIMEVKCFTSYYDADNNREVLIINVD